MLRSIVPWVLLHALVPNWLCILIVKVPTLPCQADRCTFCQCQQFTACCAYMWPSPKTQVEVEPAKHYSTHHFAASCDTHLLSQQDTLLILRSRHNFCVVVYLKLSG
jgi:hypothetical protein